MRKHLPEMTAFQKSSIGIFVFFLFPINKLIKNLQK